MAPQLSISHAGAMMAWLLIELFMERLLRMAEIQAVASIRMKHASVIWGAKLRHA